MKMIHVLATVIMASLGLATGAAAQDTGAGAAVRIELNAVKATEGSCTLSFLVTNGHASPIDKAVYETVLFDSAGQVERLTLFDFGTLPAARPRVRQFLVPGLDCAQLGRVLINGAETCTGEGLPPRACTDGLELRSRTDVEILG